jgi:hypothetical protein
MGVAHSNSAAAIAMATMMARARPDPNISLLEFQVRRECARRSRAT